jgi:GNAT superfamily N-acetyltransferase
MIDDLIIRAVTAKDYDRWIPLWDGYNAFYGRSGATALDPGITQMTWNRFFDESELVFCIVAEAGENLVGIAHYLFHRSTTAIQPVCYLQDLYTVPEIRGKGIGRSLIKEIYMKAGKAGSSRVYWMTHETNETAMKLYNDVAERSGFIVYRKTI